ncbi:MAG: hypothetical protein GC202_09595 [Alphaproteobacteria bacterium]|nr:hypothetical protein [Alphaproteobacteria bacterium]
MPNSTGFRMHPEVASTLRGLLAGAEGGSKISVVRNGDSGLSVGPLQIDLSKIDGIGAKIHEIGSTMGIAGNVNSDDLTKPHKQIDPAKEKELTAFVGAVLQTKEGQAVLADAERKQLGEVEDAVGNVCAKAGPDAQAFCNSPEGQREIAAYVHQYGTSDTRELGKFLAGKEAMLDGKTVKLDGELTVPKFRAEYRDATKWGRENPDGAASRDKRIDDFNAKNPVAPAPQQGAEAGAGKSESLLPAIPPASAAGADTAGDFSRSEIQSTDEIAGEPPADPSPKATASLAGPVGRLLAGEDGQAPDARAVKLLQATINTANRPDSFDWNWSKGGRIDVDGELGPQTLAGLARASDRMGGEEAFARRFAAASFQDYARRLDRGQARYETLPAVLDATFGRLDPDAGTALQDTLNLTREELPAHVRYPLLLRDGAIGPRTTDAFRTALYGLGPDHLAENLAAAFGDGLRGPRAGAV